MPSLRTNHVPYVLHAAEELGFEDLGAEDAPFMISAPTRANGRPHDRAYAHETYEADLRARLQPGRLDRR